MAEDWLYTKFDKAWQVSDEVEDALSGIEGQFAPVLKNIICSTYVVTENDRKMLGDFMGLQACRHPEVMNRCAKLGRELLAEIISELSMGMSAVEFQEKFSQTGITQTEAERIVTVHANMTPESADAQIDKALSLAPDNPELSKLLSLRAFDKVSEVILELGFTLLNISSRRSFILGDTPMNQSNLADGFMLPLSKSVALGVGPERNDNNGIERREATEIEIDNINQTQWDNAKLIVVGSNRDEFKKLI